MKRIVKVFWTPPDVFSAADTPSLPLSASAAKCEIVQPLLGVAVPGTWPEGMSTYDTAILQALADRPAPFQSSQQLARRAGHRHNSYFRERLALLVERGFIRQTRRGYTQPTP